MESNLESSEQRMRKLICLLMFCNLHDVTHFLITYKYFCYGWIRVAICIIQIIERLPAQDSYDTENCFYYMFPFLCIDLYNRNTLKNRLTVLVWNCRPNHNMMLSYFLFVRSAFSLFQLGLFVMCKLGHLSTDTIGEGEIRLCLCPIQVTCYTCSLLTKSLTIN